MPGPDAAMLADFAATDWAVQQRATLPDEINLFYRLQSAFTAKLLLVIALTGYQGWIGSYGRQLAAGKRPMEDRSLRIMNEVPGIAAALIVVLVIVRPF